MPNFLESGLTNTEILRFFFNFQIGRPAILDFWNLEILLANGVQRVELHQRAKYRHICQSVAKILRFFNFSTWRPPPSWIYQICEISLAYSVWKAQTHHRAECRHNRSFRCGDTAIFLFLARDSYAKRGK